MSKDSFPALLSRIDDIIEELVLVKEIEDQNYRILLSMTVKLRDQQLENLKRIQLCSDLKKSVEQVMAYSTVSDQIVCQFEQLKKKYPKQLNNVFYDFRNPETFKEPALVMSINVLISLQVQGFGSDVNKCLDLMKIRHLQYKLITNCDELHKKAFSIATYSNTLSDEPDYSQQKFDAISAELAKYREEVRRLQEENKSLHEKLAEEKSRNDILSRTMNQLSEEKLQLEKKFGMERTEYNIRIQQLVKTASASADKDNEIALLREQVNSLQAILENRKK